MRKLGIIGGSGLYRMEGLADVEETRVETPWGSPSDAIVSGTINGARLFFLPRHGRMHSIAPHQVNYRANVYALKSLGVEQLVSVSAVGSMKETMHPGDIVLVDQFIDFTESRANTFFEDHGVVAHVGFSDPIDPALSDALYRSTVETGIKVHRGGTYICIRGPHFSTRAESQLFRSWGVSVIGMTNVTEAKLAREAELPYATMALVTDYDCWHIEEAPVTVEAVLAVLHTNAANAQKVLAHVASRLPDASKSPSSSALATAVITQHGTLSQENKERYAPLLSKYWK